MKNAPVSMSTLISPLVTATPISPCLHVERTRASSARAAVLGFGSEIRPVTFEIVRVQRRQGYVLYGQRVDARRDYDIGVHLLRIGEELTIVGENILAEFNDVLLRALEREISNSV